MRGTVVRMAESETSRLVLDAMTELNIEAGASGDANAASDLVVDPGGLELRLQLKRVTLVTEDNAVRLARSLSPSGAERLDPTGWHDGLLLVVADRVTAGGRRELLAAGAGYLDLRGHIAFRTPHLIVDADVTAVPAGPKVSDPLAGRAGLEVACELLLHPESGAAVRELARRLDRSPGTVSEVLSSLRRGQLVDERHRPLGPGLFWAVADRWPRDKIYLERVPLPGDATGMTEPLRLGLHDVESTTGWALTDTAAASALGAPIAMRSDQPLDFFVPDQSVARRAQVLLGVTSTPAQARCSVRVAPLPPVCRQRLDATGSFFEWPTAQPLFVALDLAQDQGRGREVLASWTPSEGGVRVW